MIVNNGFYLGDIIANKCTAMYFEKHVEKCIYFSLLFYTSPLSLKKINIEHLIINAPEFWGH